MIRGLLLAAINGLSNSLLPFVSRAQGGQFPRQLGLLVTGSAAAALFLAGMILGRGLPAGGWVFIILGAATGLANTTNVLTYFGLVVHRGPVSVSWSVLWMGSVLVAVVGWAGFGEPVYVSQLAGLGSFVACLGAMAWATHRSAASSRGETDIRRGYWPWLLVALVSGSLGMVLMKLTDSPWARPRGHEFVFMLASYASCLVVLGAYCSVRRTRPSRDVRTVVCGGLFAAGQLGAFGGFFWGLKHLELSALSPLCAAVALSLGVLWAVIRGERPTRLALLGSLLAICSVVLINLKGPVLLGR